MNGSIKNPWVWLLVSFILVSGGVGMFLFRGGSARVLENEASAISSESEMTDGKLSAEDSEGIVKALETGDATPGESESGDDVGDTTGQEVLGEPAAVSPSASTESSLATPAKAVEPVKEADDSTATSETSPSKSSGKFSIEKKLVSWGFTASSGRKIDTVVIHSTYNALSGDPFSVSKIIDIYKSYGVSPHYLVARDGTVYRMVEEKNIAYHAGDSEMPDGRTNVNAFSIGIEVIGKDDGSPSDAQYDALKKLIADIETRHDIKHILGHSDIAPGRKSDPWGFSWKKIGGKEL
ncbi:MAG: N-acetylmuramoyl-L-alanine amidase [Candidatus Moraniibacteriota bacterium]|nr:MAG: N-acetylmuramoyl-L-alanine amidase [Candidatus Moranbacteria bacterium]